MANVYVNINNSYYSTTGNGTSSTPYNITQLSNYVSSAVKSNDVIYIKGRSDSFSVNNLAFGATSAISASNVTLKSWDFENEGYWIMNGFSDISIQTSAKFDNLVIQDFAFEAFKFRKNVSANQNETVIFKNGIFSGSPYITTASMVILETIYPSSPLYIEGCTFQGTILLADYFFIGGNWRSLSGSYIFNDCVFINSTIHDWSFTSGVHRAEFNSCVFSGTSGDVFYDFYTSSPKRVLSACTFDWNPLISNVPNFSQLSVNNKGNLAFESYGLDYSFTTRRPYWITSASTSAGSYNSKRRGPGSFYFPYNTFYVDLSSTSTTGTGSSAKPMGGRTFSADNNFYSYDNVKLKGSLTIDGLNDGRINFCNAVGIKMDAWNTSAYGPWKINFIGANSNGDYYGFVFANDIYLKNGIIFVKDSDDIVQPRLTIPSVYLENMFIQVSGFSDSEKITSLQLNTYSSKTVNIKGSTIVLPNSASIEPPQSPTNNISMIVRDSVFDTPNFCGYINYYTRLTTSAYFDNCVFSATTSGIDGICGNVFDPSNVRFSDIQLSWNPSDWPNMTQNVQKQQMSFTNLTSGTHNFTISGSENW